MYLLVFSGCTKEKNDVVPVLKSEKSNEVKSVTVQWKMFPLKTRELQKDNDTLYIEEDCFCSRRVLELDTLKKTLKVFSWCAYEKEHTTEPDFGTLELEKIVSDSTLQFSAKEIQDGHYSCLKMRVIRSGSTIEIEECNSTKVYYFTSFNNIDNYKKRVQDCDDFQG
jgi:hypothetical protein